ncbi:MAG: peptidase C56 [Inquilinus sp.]|nr:peptidase C56 [Inquilinus sp.]
MTDQPLANKTVAVLVANGFEETDMTEPQRALLAAGATIKLVSSEQALVNGWHGDGWGHYFTVDVVISDALAADFDALVVPGGERSVQKLASNPHTKRFLRGFVDGEKPLAMIGKAVTLLTVAERAAGRKLAASETEAESLQAAGAEIQEEAIFVDGPLVSAREDAASSALKDEVLRVFSDHAIALAAAA